MARAAAQAVALCTESQPWDQHPVDGFGSGLRAIAARLGGTPSTGFEVPRWVVDPKEPEPSFSRFDSGADQVLATLERLYEQRTGRNLLRKSRDVKQHRPGRRESRKRRKACRQECLVVTSPLGI